MAKKVRIGDLLVQSGVITKEQLGAALAMQTNSGGRVGSNLVELGIIDERTLASVLAQQLSIPSASAAQLDKPAKAAIERVTRANAERYRAVPLRIDGNRLWVALADPTDAQALAALERESGLEVRPMVAPDMLIDFALGKHYGVKRNARVVEVRDAQLLDVGPINELPVYDPLASAPAPKPRVAAPPPPPDSQPGLGFLDERRPSAPPPPRPAAPLALPVAPPSFMEQVRARMVAATSDEAVFSVLLEALVEASPRMALLLVRAGMLAAHRGTGIDLRSLGLIRIPITDGSGIVNILKANVPHFGPMPQELGSFFQPPGFVLPLTMGKKPIGALIGGPCAAQLPSRVAELTRIVEMVDLALHIGHLRSRLMKL